MGIIASLCACGNKEENSQTIPTLPPEKLENNVVNPDDDIDVGSFEVVDTFDIELDNYNSNILLCAGGEYTLHGASQNIMVCVDSEEDVVLNLKNAHIQSSNGPCLFIRTANSILINLVDDTKNKFETSGNNTYEALNAVIYSTYNIEFGGKGTLEIVSSVAHAVKAAECLSIHDGTYIIDSTTNCFDAKDEIVIDGGSFNLRSTGGDGIETDGEIIINNGDFTIDVFKDGIKADSNIVIHDGNFNIVNATEGIESKTNVVINNGKFNIATVDDCINAIGTLTINNGNIHAVSETNDAIDANLGIEINDGYIYAVGTTVREGAIDTDENGIVINGGTIIGLGETNSDTFEGEQRAIVLNVSTVRIVKSVTIKNDKGEVVFHVDVEPYKDGFEDTEDVVEETRPSGAGPSHNGNRPGRGDSSRPGGNSSSVGTDSMLYLSIFLSDKSFVDGLYQIFINDEYFEQITL